MEPCCLPLSTVEALLGEFHDSRSNNERKRQIDQQLVRHQNHPDAWKESLHHLRSYASDQYLWFFNATTVQLAISCRWTSAMGGDQRQQIREAIWQTYTAQQHPSKMQRDKMAQLIALMGKRDFPGDHPTYMAYVLQVLGSNFEMGITLLRATSEEVSSTKADVSSQRKADFQSAVGGSVGDCIDLLGRFLAVFADRMFGIGANGTRGQPYEELVPAIPVDEAKIISCTVECLECVQHLLSWVSLNSHLSPSLVEQLFVLAEYRDVEKLCPVSVAALTAIAELLYRQGPVCQISAIGFGLETIIRLPAVTKANEMYLDKLTELLRLFATQHWSEWTRSIDLPTILNSLYDFTFSGYGALAFTERLAIWSPLVRALSTSTCARYIERVQLLVSGILRKMQFRFDQESELDILDNDRLDDDNETEWQQYLRQCIETICLIANGRPVQVFEQVYSDWQRPFEMFTSLEKSHNGHALTITDYQRCHLIHCVTRDLTSLCQCLTSLIPILHARPDNLPPNLHQLTANLVSAVGFMSTTKLHRLTVTMPQITTDFIEFFAQIMSALRSFLAWSPALHTEATLKPLIEQVASVLVPAAGSHQGGEPKMLTLAAGQLLLSITTVLRPKYALESPSLQQLVQAGPRLQHLDPMAAEFVHQAIVQCFVLPWSLGVSSAAASPASGEQDMERRAMLLQEYVASISYDLLRLDDTLASGQQDKIVKISTTVLPVLSGCLGHFTDHSTAVKNMILAAYKPTIAKSISLFNSFGTVNTDFADAVLNFSLTVVRTLQMQLGAGHIKEMLSIFLEASTRERITVGRLKAMDKLLQMLLLVVEQPGSTGLSLLPAILTVSLDLVQPLFGAGNRPDDLSDVTVSLFSLFDGILHHRWQYFYKSQVLRGFSPAERSDDPASSEAEAPPQHPEQLLAILTAYGHALVGAANDPHVMRLLLRSLHSLHERYRLFGRRFFRDHLLSSFHCALINALLSATGALHLDQLLGVLFTMGQVSMAQLHASFVALGCATDSRAIEAVCLSVDLPTFSQHMAHLIQDTRCSQLTSGTQ